MAKKPKLARIVILLAAIVSACTAFYFIAVTPAPDNGWRRYDVATVVFNSERNLKLFATSEIMVARRLTPAEHGGSLLANYEMGPEVPVPQANMDLIRNLIQQKSSYDWGVIAMCLPEYGVLLTSRDESGEEVHLALCFKCHQLSVFEGNEIVSTVDFRKMSRRIAALIKPLFPDDPEIQALP